MTKKYILICTSWLISIFLAVFLTVCILFYHTEPAGEIELQNGVSVIKISGTTVYEFSDGTSTEIIETTIYEK